MQKTNYFIHKSNIYEGGLHKIPIFKESTREQPLVSIVTVVFNGEVFLDETIRSIQNQTYKNIEHIIIDGGSKDGTLEIIKRHENKVDYWISESDDGQTSALIKGFNLSRGDILYWLNYDDLLFSNSAIQDVVDNFSENIDLVYGDDALIDEDGNIFKVRSFRLHSFHRTLYHKSISQPSAFFSKRAYERFGLNEKLLCSMDLELWLNIFKNCRTKYCGNILSKNRIHPGRKMIKFIEEARVESDLLRLNHGASRLLRPLIKPFFKLLEIYNKWMALSLLIALRAKK